MRSAGTLSSRHQSVGDGHRRVPDARSRPVPQRRLRPRQALQAGRLPELQLHGTADGLRAVASLAAGRRSRRVAAVPGRGSGAPGRRRGRARDGGLLVRDYGPSGPDLLLVADQ